MTKSTGLQVKLSSVSKEINKTRLSSVIIKRRLLKKIVRTSLSSEIKIKFTSGIIKMRLSSVIIKTRPDSLNHSFPFSDQCLSHCRNDYISVSYEQSEKKKNNQSVFFLFSLRLILIVFCKFTKALYCSISKLYNSTDTFKIHGLSLIYQRY